MSGESITFIKNSIARAINHLVRETEEVDGSVRIEVNSDDTYTIYVHRGTESKPTIIEDVSKDKMMDMLEGQL